LDLSVLVSMIHRHGNDYFQSYSVLPLFFDFFNPFVSLSNVNIESCVLLHFTDTCGDYTGQLNISNMVSGA